MSDTTESTPLGEIAGFENVDWAGTLKQVAALLARRMRRRWDSPQWCVWVTPEGFDVIARSEAIGRFRAAALDAVATEAQRRRVPPGSILVWFESENPDVTGLKVWRLK